MRLSFFLLRWVSWIVLFLGLTPSSSTSEPVILSVDFAKTNGLFRALHGVNKGPLGPGGLLDLTAEHRALGIPLTRLHDCYWPNPYVVDIHAVFPDFKADPSLPESYDFRLTDEYISAVRATGAGIVYRLGESIEHTSVKRFVHPPANYDTWAEICLGILRHYNEGWARGFHHDIKYWEIWNEPENRPVMWSGNDEDYFRLYRVAAVAIKRAFPLVKVGGPAVGASGQFVGGKFKPTDFVTHFLQLCRTASLPLDFFSWHCYTADPSELVLRTKAIRQLLDENGFIKTESHLNEWNYLPGNSWTPLARNSPSPDRQRYYEEMSGAAGAAFIACSLIGLQDVPLDMGNLFHGEAGAFGLFNEFGVPQKNYFAVRAFHDLLGTPRRVESNGAAVGRAIAAGLNASDSQATVLISNFAEDRSEFRVELNHLPWSGDTLAELRIVNAYHNPDAVRTETIESQKPYLSLRLAKPTVALIQLRPAKPTAQYALKITSPANRLVFQRNHAGRAEIPITVTTSLPHSIVEARLVTVGHPEQPSFWKNLGAAKADGTFIGCLGVESGWYQLELRATSAAGAITQSKVDRVGVGEVFVIVGHSVAQGGDINLPGSTDDRVNTVALDLDYPETQRSYERTADTQFLPEPVGVQFASGVQPAPFGHGTYFWARFGELVAKKEKVPVMIFNAGFGGTSLEHWAKSARGEAFEHSFVKSPLRMPYINVRNTWQRYVSVTGVRAILADQGQNDANEPDATVIVNNYRTWIDQARKDLGYAGLAVVVNRQTPYLQRTVIRQAQERILHEVPHCFTGPDYDLLAPEDRYDRIHLSLSGAEGAARLWAEALDSEFFSKSSPFQPR